MTLDYYQTTKLLILIFCFIFWGVDGQQCEDYNSMAEAGPKIHGKVQRKGILELNVWWNQNGAEWFGNLTRTVLDDRKYDVIDAKLYREGAPVQFNKQDDTEYLPMAAPCQVFFNHKHKIIYLKNPKTGSGSISLMLKKGCWHDKSETGEKLGHNCYDVPKTKDIPDRETAEKIWKDYFIVATVRNPYARAASMYTYLLKRRVDLNRHNKRGCRSPTFLQFTQSPFMLGIQSNKYECIERKIHDYHHVEREFQCLLNKEGKLTVDYIISMEHVQEDWKGFLEEYELKMGLNLTDVDKNSENYKYFNKVKGVGMLHQNKVSQTPYIKDVFNQCAADCVDYVTKNYKEDFEVLGYHKC